MARSTFTKRTPVRPSTVPKGEPERLDLGTVVLPRGSVEHKDGVPHTAAVWAVDGDRRSARHVYVDTVRPVES
jgi:hypothetical protein